MYFFWKPFVSTCFFCKILLIIRTILVLVLVLIKNHTIDKCTSRNSSCRKIVYVKAIGYIVKKVENSQQYILSISNDNLLPLGNEI